MEWMLIALLWWKEPAPSLTRFASEEECKTAGHMLVAFAKKSQNKGTFECLPVKRLGYLDQAGK